MDNLSDRQLLRDFAERRSEAAFAELVRRHIDLVYSAAKRMVREAHLAEDVAQAVFVALARSAGQLTECSVLSGWLHRTAQNLAANSVRSDVRRRAREQKAAAMNECLAAEPNASWEGIAPHLDAALGELSVSDRDAVLLRYFERKSAREMAQTLGVSEDAAQRRVSRAVERLRECFAKRGLTIGTSGLVVLLANAVQAAPAGLAATFCAASLGGAATGSGAFALVKWMAMTKTKASLAVTIVVVSVVTPLMMHLEAQDKARQTDKRLQQVNGRLAPLRAQIEQLSNRLAQSKSFWQPAKDSWNELLRLRGEVSRLRREVQELARPKPVAPPSRTEVLVSLAQRYSERTSQLKAFLEANPSENIPEIQLLTDTDWLWLAGQEAPGTEEGFQRMMSLARTMAESNVGRDILRPALVQYAQDNNGQFPSNLSQLTAYLKEPLDEAILQRWHILHASKLINLRGQLENEDWVITQKAPVNRALDQRFIFSLKNVHLLSDAPPEHWNTGT